MRKNTRIIVSLIHLLKPLKVSRSVVFNEENANLRISQPASTFLFTIDEDDSNTKDYADEVQDNLLNNPNSDNAGNYGLRPRNTLRVPSRHELNVADIATPQTYKEALNSPQADNWKEAIKEELNSLEKKETWDLVPVPETTNVIGSNRTILSSESNPLPEGTTIPYRETIGSLMFLAITTRPDIGFAVNVVSRFQSNPGQVNWNAVKRIFRYLKGTAAYCIEYSPVIDSVCHFIGYSDADFANDVDTRMSTSCYVLKLSNGPVT
ncbi:Retrovirus-related Pol polyprotein from transposon TNT 1-94 [Araneus ventricosus]|uniref:Retrovirus-related Pol polyprotein from transposon TNT 1-94 n=1 Tax=Araneus ventricosus TaxID=182803 RepID=A0A4Y2NXM9_ARAVE|nr:Retrovirus-related Pol polyprotein from transposon TNT 1-94 [Araneus ventricosus]